MTLPLPDSRPLQPSTSEGSSQALCVVSTFTGPRQALQRAHVPFVMRHVADPVLDGADGRHLLAHPEQRVLGIALAGRERILEGDQRQVGGVGDALEVGERHLRRLSQREGRRRKHQQRRGAALGRHAGEPRRLQAAVGPDAVDERQPAADLVLGDGEHTALLLEGAGRDLGGMGVDGDGGDAGGRRHVAQVLAEARLVDGEIGIEGQQHRRDDAVGQIGLVPGHGAHLESCSRQHRRSTAKAPDCPVSVAPAHEGLSPTGPTG